MILGDDAAVLAKSSCESLRDRTATPSSRRRVDGVEVDATIQHEGAVKSLFPHGTTPKLQTSADGPS